MFFKKRRRSGSGPTVYGIVGNGQSLSTGDRAGSPAYTPFFAGPVSGSYMLTDIDNLFTNPVSAWTLTDLQEPMRGTGYGTAYPYNVSFQSLHTPMGYYLNLNYGLNTAHTCAGQSGQPYSVIKKNGTGNSYESSIQEVTRFKQLFDALNINYEVAAVIWTHGESDYGNASYSDYLLEAYNDYNTDIKAITGQTSNIKFLITQPSAGYPTAVGEYSNIPDEMLEAYLAHPDKITLVGSKTALDYVPGDYHLTAVGTTFLGFTYGVVLGKLMNNISFTPLYATSATAVGTTITVNFNRNAVEDNTYFTTENTHATEHTYWLNGKGFEVIDAGNNPLTITSTVISGSTATIEVSSGIPYRVSYTLYGDGPGTIRRGCIRDDDLDGFNWLCQFSKIL